MKDILQDIIAHTHSLGVLSLLKVSNLDDATTIESMSDDRKVVMTATAHSPVDDFIGVFGMPNLEKLNLLLKNPEYKDNATIEVIEGVRNGETIPTHIHFENENKDFQNDYRFMNKEIIEERLKSVKFKGATWNIEFIPSITSITKLKLMSAVHTEETNFSVSTQKTGSATDLIFSFGDASTHAGEFVFQNSIEGSLRSAWNWPIDEVQKILNLSGDIEMKISDQGVMLISVNSGMVRYDYYLPAQSK